MLLLERGRRRPWGLFLARAAAASLAWLAAAPAPAQIDVGEQRECASCHIMWLRDFKRTDVTPLVPYDPKPKTDTGRQDVSSTERMCFSCHDGFMLDSRGTWKGGHGHPVGVKPSDKVKIPTADGKVVFPLNEDGKLYCGSCHTAHGVDWNQSVSPLFLRQKNVDSSICLACHLDQGAGKKGGNHPLFRPVKSLPGVLSRGGGRLGHENGVICQSCHRVHGAAEKRLLVAGNREGELCGSCHGEKREVVKTSHDLGVSVPGARNRLGEVVAEGGPCSGCHAPHKAQGPMLWAGELGQGVDGATARCAGCHREGGVAGKKMAGDHGHPVNVGVSDLGISASRTQWTSTRFAALVKDRPLTPLPLYDEQGARAAQGGRIGCASCHDPHASAQAKAGRGKEEGGSGNFLRLADDGGAHNLCANCHVEKGAVLYSKHNPVVYRAGAAEGGQKVCGSCHKPHRPKGPYLWGRESGAGDGAVEKLCGDCHRAGGVAEKKLTGGHSHPVGVELKGGQTPKGLPLYARDGKLVNAGGWVDCSTCHDPHQWDPGNAGSRAGADLKAKGTGMTSFLRLRNSDSSLCVSCHAEQGRVRGTDHDLSVTAPRAENFLGETVAESGACGQCHSAHNAVSELRLWGLGPGEGDNPAEGLCRSCHADGKAAAAKAIPLKPLHPKTVQVWSNEARLRTGAISSKVMPLYDESGKPAQYGVITCLTCHDPHQWRADRPEPGPGRRTDGDARSSFLRLSDTRFFLCAECHGPDGLYRYSYFHSPLSRRGHPVFR